MKISVIIPTHNRQNLLQEAVNSVLSQDFKQFEMIIVDDGSTDRNPQHLSRLDQRIRYLYTPNRGVSKARNTGIRAARGNFITFLDADDLWQPRKLKQQYHFMQQQRDAKICYTNSIWIRNNEQVTPPRHYLPCGGWIWEKLVACCFLGASTVMLKRALLEETGLFDESLPVCEDYDLWLRIAARYPIHFLEQQLVIRRAGSWPQLSSAYWGMDRFRIKAMEKLLSGNNLTPQQKSLLKKNIEEKARILARGCLKHQRYLSALRYLWKTIN